MIQAIAAKIISIFEKNDVLEHEREIYQHGLELILSYMVGFTIQIIFCIFSGFWIETAMFIVFFESLRKYTGGYHAKTYWGCNVSYLFAYGIYYLFVINMEVPLLIIIITFIISSLFICVKAPVTHEHNPLSKIEMKQYKKRSILLICMFSLIFIGLIVYNEVYYALTLVIPIFMNAILMMLGLLFNERGDLD
ncbi:accessory gene regulator B family protein [Breznakia pachnodae]|uniref:Accessory gene regulator B n=1 Tax=Breznakia pachnodae TaxID=265178 RepID=A0ABU0E1F8_9FIRM|nr:accessory gene regulator B family protein [Breznakia pachnodae]MDQ0360630.1 accessory gene regulator B [Breznakia pachnodae]